METNPQSYYLEDEIDVRKIINTLFRYKWVIIGLTLLLAVVGFGVTKLMMPKQYEATALVVITKPALTANLDPRIQTTLQMPDAKSLTDLTLADDLLLEIFQDPQLAGKLDTTAPPNGLKDQLHPTLVGTNQLTLSVTDSDPQRAALIANVWADKVASRLIAIYGINDASLSQQENQRDVARQNWQTAEKALLDYMPQNKVDVLKVNYNQAQTTLSRYLEKSRGLDLLIGDSQALDTRLSKQQDDVPLSFGDALSVISLQQRSAGEASQSDQATGLQIQFSDSSVVGEKQTVGAARTSLQSLISSLQSQRESLQAGMKEQEDKITALASDLESAQYKLTQLTVQRDLALNSYQALSNQVEETRITLSQYDQLAKVAGKALAPNQPSGPRASINTAMGGALGLILSIFAVLVFNWWRSPQPSTPEIKTAKVA